LGGEAVNTDLAVIVEASGFSAMAFTAWWFAAFAPGVRRLVGLRPALFFIGLFASTNVFYAAAYWGTTGGGGWNWWDTPTEQVIRAAQILSVWTVPILMVIATRSLVRGESNVDG
jgi:hypothetical protein